MCQVAFCHADARIKNNIRYGNEKTHTAIAMEYHRH